MKSVFIVLFFLTAFIVNAQTSEKWFKSGSIKLEYRPSPLYYVFNQSTTNRAGSPGWLVVKIKYSTVNKKSGAKIVWLDDVTMETEIILPGNYKSEDVTVLLKGKTVFWSIPMDGKVHQAVASVPPQVVARFARSKNKIELSKMIVRVTFYKAGRKIIMRMYNSSNSRVKNYFSNKVDGAISSGLLIVDDIVMPRNKTPWGVINYELFDVIKPDPQK